MIWLIPFFPLLGFLINGSWYAFFQSSENSKKASSAVTGSLATAAIFSSFVVSLLGFFNLKGMESEEKIISEFLFNWISVAGLNLNVELKLDQLSSLFCLVITGVGTLIHIYSIGYMSHDESPGKFFSYLNLFCFAMLVLVLGGSLPVLFFGWEGVGLCSYLLIGYWYTDMDKAIAGKKAFIVNRIGDLGVIIGIFILFQLFGTLDFYELKMKVAEQATTLDLTLVTAACLLLFVGCTGKSAQIPLYVWLPDAMAGPTPVSALIHAATMVTSGIYLLSRLSFLFVLSPTAMQVIAYTGGLTALMAATIAIVQTDIKKVLAYSTVSQLGYMFMACGVGAFSAGVFHVITHAFFKALLFLGAGSVIHGMSEEQDILKMGGLKKYMPQTFMVFAIAWLAICGVPPFSGFFSKDEVLWKAFSSSLGSPVLWLIGAATAVMTAFYMTRLFSLTFLGEHRTHSKDHHPHESPLVMTGPLMVLAVLSAIGGFIGIPHISWLEHWLEPVVKDITESHVNHSLEWVLMGISVVGAGVGIFTALKLYRNLKKPEEMKQNHSGLHGFLNNKWFVDEAYFAAIVNPLVHFSKALWKGFDVAVIDRIVMGFGRASQLSGQMLRMTQTGLLQSYGMVFIIGLLLTLGYFIYGLARI